MSRLESRALQVSDNDDNGRLKVGQPIIFIKKLNFNIFGIDQYFGIKLN